jgi:hypothetical protein
VIPLDSWQAVVSPTAKPDGPVIFGLDVSEERASGAIVACDATGTLELIEHRDGVGWVAGRANELAERHQAPVWIDETGPASIFVKDIPMVRKMKRGDILRACGAIFDAIGQQRVTFRADPAFDEAVAGVVKREVADLWGWSRKASVTDITPLMAATIAFAQATNRSVYHSRGLVIA